MIQFCGKEIVLPLELLFKSLLEEGIFPEDWKKSNVLPFHKKESKNLIKNYRPFSLLPTKCQSGFMPGDSCVAQLLLITPEVCKSFDCNPLAYTRGIFLDILKDFDKV